MNRQDVFAKHLMSLPDESRITVFEKKRGQVLSFEKTYSAKFVKDEYRKAILNSVEETENKIFMRFTNNLRSVLIEVEK